jgi:hypothetical protein
MRKSYLNLALVLFLFWSGCQDDDVITSPHYSNQLTSKWEFTGGTNGVWPGLKYLIFNPDNYFYFLFNLEANEHEIIDGVYSITGNQVNMNQVGLFIFSINDDTLTLDNSNHSMTFVRNTSAPAETEWLIPATIEKEIPLADSIRIGDITFDGTHFWGSGGSDIINKLDTLGNLLVSFPIYNTGGITYSNGNLWISCYDTLKKVNPLNGQIIGQQEIPGANELYALAYEDGYIWARKSGEYIKIKEETGEVVHSIPAYHPIDGFEFRDSLLWVPDDSKIYSIETDSGKVISNYQVTGNSGYSRGLGFDGTAFWRVITRYDEVNYSIQKLNVPL